MKILQTLKKLLWGYKQEQEAEYAEQIGISFYLTEDSDIDIACHIDNLKFENLDILTKNAEKYAELLVLLHSGLLKYQTLAIISEYSKAQDENGMSNKLFADNILSFYTLINNKVHKARATNQPLIRPTNVFNISHEE